VISSCHNVEWFYLIFNYLTYVGHVIPTKSSDVFRDEYWKNRPCFKTRLHVTSSPGDVPTQNRIVCCTLLSYYDNRAVRISASPWRRRIASFRWAWRVVVVYTLFVSHIILFHLPKTHTHIYIYIYIYIHMHTHNNRWVTVTSRTRVFVSTPSACPAHSRLRSLAPHRYYHPLDV